MQKRFNRNGLAVVGLAACCVFLSGVSMLHARKNVTRAPATPVAVIDWLGVANGLDEWQEAQATLNDKQTALNQELEQRRSKIVEMEDAYKLFPENSPGYTEQRESLMQEQAMFSAWAETTQNNLVARELVGQLNAYKKIREAVAVVAAQEGYDIVLWADLTTPVVDLTRLQDSAQRISTRQVLYTSDQVNITAQVTEYMNRMYKK